MIKFKMHITLKIVNTEMLQNKGYILLVNYFLNIVQASSRRYLSNSNRYLHIKKVNMYNKKTKHCKNIVVC